MGQSGRREREEAQILVTTYPELADYRSAAIALIQRVRWKGLFSYVFADGSPHINLKEALALLSLLKRRIRQGVRNARVDVFLDSRVVIGAVAELRAELAARFGSVSGSFARPSNPIGSADSASGFRVSETGS